MYLKCGAGTSRDFLTAFLTGLKTRVAETQYFTLDIPVKMDLPGFIEVLEGAIYNILYDQYDACM